MKLLDFEIERYSVMIFTECGREIKADKSDLIDINENFVMFLNDWFYYRAEIREVMQQYLDEMEVLC